MQGELGLKGGCASDPPNRKRQDATRPRATDTFLAVTPPAMASCAVVLGSIWPLLRLCGLDESTALNLSALVVRSHAIKSPSHRERSVWGAVVGSWRWRLSWRLSVRRRFSHRLALRASTTLQRPCYQPPATSHQPPATSHQPPATSHQPPATSHQPPATSHQLPATSYQLPGSGCHH
jgi:hypothetical protein